MGRTTHSTHTTITCTSAPQTVPGRCTCRLGKAPSPRRPGLDRGTAAHRVSATTIGKRIQRRHTTGKMCGAVISRFRPVGKPIVVTPLKGTTSPHPVWEPFFNSTRPQLKRFRRLQQPRRHLSLGVRARRYPSSTVLVASSEADVFSVLGELW